MILLMYFMYVSTISFMKKIDQLAINKNSHNDLYIATTRKREHEILVPIELSSNEWSGEPVQMHRLTRTFAARINKVMSF